MWMLTGDFGGYVKYWQTNMNNVKMYQAHKDPVRGLRWASEQRASIVRAAKSTVWLVVVERDCDCKLVIINNRLCMLFAMINCCICVTIFLEFLLITNKVISITHLFGQIGKFHYYVIIHYVLNIFKK